ncbi:hypothetical protein LPJ59_000778 [Coemansia sp. RSA 2399]|nr:hypothetical protein LPJ59_000778 [Coemansia sp. RSA 2399]KAJ1896094.1 hypothetical protein LPJ81_004816 [Coemansia sp. IMI 209127]
MSTLAKHLQGRKDATTLTVLRVKRKRDQEPLDALVIHQQQRRVAKTRRTAASASRSATPSIYDVDEGPVVFSLGETVSEDDFGNARKRAALQERLAMLQGKQQQHQQQQQQQQSTDEMMDTDSEPVVQKPVDSMVVGRPTQFCVIGGRQVPLTDDVPPTAADIAFELNYGIPQVYATTELNASSAVHRRIKMFDAITEQDVESLRMAESKERREKQQQQQMMPVSADRTQREEPRKENMVEDELVPMVRDRLTFRATPTSEYVYDLYYIQSRPLLAPRSALDPSVGSVLWVDDIDELLDANASDSDGNIDDDDDSNAEDYYANDYPDDPDSSSGVYEYYYSSEEREELRGMEGDDDGEDGVW